MANRSSFDPDNLDDLAKDVIRELKATGELVSDAAKQGKEELRQYVSENLQNAGDSIRSAREHYSEAFRKELDRFEEQRHQREAKRENSSAGSAPVSGKSESAAGGAPVRARKKNRIRTAGRFSGFWLTVGSAFLLPGVLFGLKGIYELFTGTLEAGIIPAAVMFILTGIFPFSAGVRQRKKAKLYERCRTVVGDAPSISLRRLAALTDRSFGKTLTDVTDMVSRGYFGPEAVLDPAAGLLIIDPERAGAEAEAQENAETEAEEAAADSYSVMLAELHRLNERIPGEEMTRQIARIETVARATFAAVREHPEKRSQITRFMDYYLPTTIKLLNSYAGFEKQEVMGENIRQSRESIEKMTETLADAFEKQYDTLFREETLDIDAEIRTMDSLLRQDGLAGGMKMPR